MWAQIKTVESEDAEASWNPKTMREAEPGPLKRGKRAEAFLHLSIHRSLHMASLSLSWLMELSYLSLHHLSVRLPLLSGPLSCLPKYQLFSCGPVIGH